MYPHLVGSTFFSLCSLSQYIYFFHVHKFFRVSGLGISARARGNFMRNSILSSNVKPTFFKDRLLSFSY